MNTKDRIRYNLVYSEQIKRYLVNFGLTLEEADLFHFNAAKGQGVELFRNKFTGNQKQWDLLRDACDGAVHSSHAIAIFLSER